MPELPHLISLPIIRDMKQLRGALSTYEKDSYIMAVRMTDEDHALIKRIAAACGTTQSLFTRWYCVAAAARIDQLLNGKTSLWLTPPLPNR